MASAAPVIPALARDRAFEVLYRQYVNDVYHYALALLRNPADAEDVTQTTFMNAYRAYKRGENIRKPQHWLIKIAHNVARSRYACAGRRVREVPLDDHLDQLAVPEQERPDIKAVLDALGRLSLNQRAALVMRELEGRPYAEIADTIGISVSAVETLIFRARRSLRLKSSTLRVLSIVPVPPSLTQLFEAGTVVVGGSALVGSGFLFKAALAIVAGVVATGIGGSGGSHSAADARRQALPRSGRSVDPEAGLRALAPGSTANRVATTRFRRGSGTSPVAARTNAGPLVDQSGQSASSGQPPTSQALPTTQQATTTATTTVTTSVTTVSDAVSTVTSAAPVGTPTLPPLPTVTVPPLP